MNAIDKRYYQSSRDGERVSVRRCIRTARHALLLPPLLLPPLLLQALCLLLLLHRYLQNIIFELRDQVSGTYDLKTKQRFALRYPTELTPWPCM
eukprot:COSAG01_NODE_226_length_21147_cov_59.226435_21_plen_94_part_00